MAKLNQFTAFQIDNLTKQGRHAIGEGLYLEIDDSGKRWLLRYQLKGKRTFFGLGGYNKKTNSLAIARQKVTEAKLLIARGIHPVEQSKAEKDARAALEVQAKREVDAKKYTFEVVAEQYIDSKRAEWRNKKHATQWLNTLRANAFPFFGDMPVRDIEKADVIRCLNPIWKTKTETASRVRGRIEAILDYAQVSGWRNEGANPARWKGHLSKLYPSPGQAKKVRDIEAESDGHHPAMAFEELPEFYLRLSNRAGVAAKALQLTILTAVRTASIRFAKWSQFDLDKKLWIIPAGNMKSGEEFRVALSDHAIDLLKEMPRLDDWVFVGGKQGKPLSDGAMLSLLRRMDRTDVTVHGFRSTFRDWVGEETNFPTNLAEYALAHKLGNETERAYARGDQLEKRRELMEAWGSYVNSLGKASPQMAAVGNDF